MERSVKLAMRSNSTTGQRSAEDQAQHHTPPGLGVDLVRFAREQDSLTSNTDCAPKAIRMRAETKPRKVAHC
jgi:hypothetical protein